ncbi:uncharacterized protein M6B38_241270 [Iris pallida]|uniref:Wall-associated receptor kinase galacturonan-binding domain-containing protein n=1 Tax=Iris pallida TaxID=29817 RepID=A0AAX6DJ12_IRIPA|nr:uncharacterized protein M6B38_241270 [Iris pallida]
MMICNVPQISLLLLLSLVPHAVSDTTAVLPCRSYCGNITIDYPFGLRSGCGHSGYRDLLYCINGMLMLHIPSGSYRVLNIDYAYRSLTLHDSSMSDCYSLALSTSATPATAATDGFIIEPWRAPYLAPAPDNVFMLLGCHADSPLFQGFPGKHLPCRNVSGMGCDEYYRCPAWQYSKFSARKGDSPYGSVNPPECCSMEFGAIRAINLTHLGCQGYSSAYSLAPLRARGPGAWSYGIRVSYSVPADHDGDCRGCQATGGVCGYDPATEADICICGSGQNSTSNCDTVSSSSSIVKWSSSLASLIGGLLIYTVVRFLCY